MLTLKEIQYEEKEMLRDLIKFFHKNNFKYYIWAGSFLGAVRHKGFIPWDDDIDVCMTRPEYERLKKYIKSKGKRIKKNLEFLGYEIDGSYYPFLKLINTDIEVSERTNTTKNLWIDIFPLDGIGENVEMVFKRHKIVWKIYMFIAAAHYNEMPKKDSTKHFIKYYLYKISKRISLDFVIKKYLKHCQKYNYDDCKNITNLIWGFSNVPCYYTKDLLKDKEYKFEDLTVNGMEDYDIILKRTYGDYMKLPPVDQRQTHNFKAWRKEYED